MAYVKLILPAIAVVLSSCCFGPYPPERQCVKTHTETTFMMVPMHIGKVTMIRYQPMYRIVCDERESDASFYPRWRAWKERRDKECQ